MWYPAEISCWAFLLRLFRVGHDVNKCPHSNEIALSEFNEDCGGFHDVVSCTLLLTLAETTKTGQFASDSSTAGERLFIFRLDVGAFSCLLLFGLTTATTRFYSFFV